MTLNKTRGFTIVELLIVIVVIGILAAITIVAYSGIQNRANAAQRDTDIATIEKAIVAARTNTGNTSVAITGTGMTSVNCERVAGNPSSVEPRLLDKNTHACWVDWRRTLDRLSTASGMNLRDLYDGDHRGNPYYMNENEGEYNGGSLCADDHIGYFTGNGVFFTVTKELKAQSVC